MTKPYHLLIADKNPHIRNFLKREFTASGYIVHLAETGKELLNITYGPTPLDLLIIDPDFPDADESYLTKKLQNRMPQLPVVLHTLNTELDTGFPPLRVAQLIEKDGSSVENLKQAVAKMLAALVP
ncbi:hypothetical protein DSCO28_09570 [Desulfosarcina ovata subsp. sediminis]|uniref:Response regulatory domain-containing protein n=1 Tax=Desulfosarcina ovata subsp. sediminis TaxID=885957 RepID=A0A5K7ZHQ6_9BACT|nr:response regulator [Desulfosarcina ovata]BBO80391.1 hypothetical protein DSCO28_09570 [Desulfosarcina ovata subsp. sediminis]